MQIFSFQKDAKRLPENDHIVGDAIRINAISIFDKTLVYTIVCCRIVHFHLSLRLLLTWPALLLLSFAYIFILVCVEKIETKTIEKNTSKEKMSNDENIERVKMSKKL